MEKLFVAYYRVSTVKQGRSHLGLDAQRDTVLNYIRHNGNKVIGEYTEIESGKNNDRPELLKAVNLCKQKDAILTIAKLDRLSRNVAFISALMESKVNFLACDMPDATPMTLHIFAAIAQFERERISQRIKEALKAAKARGKTLGNINNLTMEGRIAAHVAISKKAIEDQSVRFAWHFIKPLREVGLSYNAIAMQLDKQGYQTRTGCTWHASQVYNIFKRFNEVELNKNK